MPKRKSNGPNNNDGNCRIALSPAQHLALNALAATMPPPKRYSFLLATMLSLKVDAHGGTVSDQQVQQAIAHALEQHA
jgi:hypothetical protein